MNSGGGNGGGGGGGGGGEHPAPPTPCIWQQGIFCCLMIHLTQVEQFFNIFNPISVFILQYTRTEKLDKI